MADLLSVWNEALRLIKEPQLTATTGNDKISRTLRSATPGATQKCLESGTWNFGQLRRWLNKSSQVPEGEYQFYYEKPAGWVRTVFISASGHSEDPLLDYKDEQGMIATNRESVFMVFVSIEFNETNSGTWSQSFADYVSAELAERVAPDLVSASAEQMDVLKKEKKIRKGEALAFDAQQNPPMRMGRGRWSRAGRGGRNISGRMIG